MTYINNCPSSQEKYKYFITKFKKKLGYYVLVVKPSFGCSTNLIYSKVKYFSKPKYNSPKQSLFNTKNIVNSKNDLEQIVFKIYPKLKKLKLFLKRKSFIPSKINSPDFSSKADSPIITNGFFAFFIFS